METPIGEFVFKRSAPDFVLASREVVGHVCALHARDYCDELLQAFVCDRTIAAVCPSCNRPVYVLVRDGFVCVHAMMLAHGVAAMRWLPAS